jgi:hypothetical protein
MDMSWTPWTWGHDAEYPASPTTVLHTDVALLHGTDAGWARSPNPFEP